DTDHSKFSISGSRRVQIRPQDGQRAPGRAQTILSAPPGEGKTARLSTYRRVSCATSGRQQASGRKPKPRNLVDPHFRGAKADINRAGPSPGRCGFWVRTRWTWGA